MPEADSTESKDFHDGVAPPDNGFFLKGVGRLRLGDEEPPRADLPARQRAGP